MISKDVNDGHLALRSVLAPQRPRGAAKCMEVHHGNHSQRGSLRAVEQGQDRRTEGAVQAQGQLGAARQADVDKACTLRPMQAAVVTHRIAFGRERVTRW